MIDVLYDIGTDDSLSEAIVLAKSQSEKGDINAMGRLARAYRDGRGVTKDLQESAKWYRKANTKQNNLIDELIDVLYRIGTYETIQESLKYTKG